MLETETPRPKLTRESLREAFKIFSFIQPYRWHFALGMILLLLSSALFMGILSAVGMMLDIAQGKPVPFDLTLGNIAFLLVAALVAQGIISYVRVRMFAIVSEYGTADIRKAVYQKLVTLPMVFFEKSRVGELVSRLTNDVEKLYSTFYFVLAEFVRQIFLLIGGIIFLAWQTPRLAGVMLAVFPIIVIGAMIFGRRIRTLSKERQNSLAESNTILDETLQSIQAVKAFTNELFEIGRFRRSNDNVVRVSMKFASGRAIFAVFIITVLFGALFFIIWVAMSMVQEGKISGGQVISFASFTAVIGAAIAGLGNFYSELVGAVGATERVREILNTPSETDTRSGGNLTAGHFQGDVVFENVRFSYPTRADVTVLKDVSLHIEPGTRVALVGQSGAGKSTIMQLLLQFHHLSGGAIRVDGRSIYDYDLETYRRNFAIVPQEVILFGGTIRENILYGKPEATEAELVEAARKANAWEFISAFPEGLDTIVGERGIKLSGGQRQRIAIARAILRDPSILLLDEATSSLDAESEKVVQEALNNLMEGRTSIIIAHRLATIRDVDRIYVLEHGQIVEEGSHQELSELENGVYGSLARLQFDAINQ